MDIQSIKRVLGDLLLKSNLPLTDTPDVLGVSADSRTVYPGYLFVAVAGTLENGGRYIADALERGASALVMEESTFSSQKIPTEVPFFVVTDAREALAALACEMYGHPSRELCLVGITGTNGKTTTVTLLYNLFEQMGYKCGLISTVCVRYGEKKIEAHHTTPDAVELNALLREMSDSGCSYVFMEVSSHALVQKRVHGVDFDVAVFSNITRDHLDYHGSFSEYIRAKKIFFDSLAPQATALINKDDRNAAIMLQNCAAQSRTYALHSWADYKAEVLELHVDGTLLTIDGIELNSQLCGIYNVYNLLAVYSVARILLPNYDPQKLCVELSRLSSVEGRFETLRSPKGYFAVVDYAHTPDALENVLATLTQLKPQRIITVVGAGGNRDKGKRPEMARIAVHYSNELILTSDNPRNEEPSEILSDMMEGIDKQDKQRVLQIENRREAIKTACRLAKPGDVILIAGKGHETYQEISGVRYHFDDREELRSVFETEE